jgi:hypothetical protein
VPSGKRKFNRPICVAKTYRRTDPTDPAAAIAKYRKITVFMRISANKKPWRADCLPGLMVGLLAGN